MDDQEMFKHLRGFDRMQERPIKFYELLFLLFLGLKLSNHIDWSWWWIFAPIWIYWGYKLTKGTMLYIKIKKGKL